MSHDVVNGQVGTMAVDARVGHAGTRIDLDEVTKRYRVGDVDVTAIDGINLHVDEAAFVVIVGPSGCGKTTLLNMIGALDTPTSGSVRVAGVDVTGASQADRCDAATAQRELHLPDVQSVPGPHGVRERPVRCRCCTHAGSAPSGRSRRWPMSGWPTAMRHFPHQLSGGEQQRVAIARALATGNPILLADEPTGELDFRTGVQILEVLEEQARAGMTVLVVTHNREISRVADRVIELSSGRIVADGPPRGRQGRHR